MISGVTAGRERKKRGLDDSFLAPALNVRGELLLVLDVSKRATPAPGERSAAGFLRPPPLSLLLSDRAEPPFSWLSFICYHLYPSRYKTSPSRSNPNVSPIHFNFNFDASSSFDLCTDGPLHQSVDRLPGRPGPESSRLQPQPPLL